MEPIEKLWKYCNRCDRWRTKVSFGKQIVNKDGLKGSCKLCLGQIHEEPEWNQ